MNRPGKMISVIVCTYNRCGSLQDTLRSLSELNMNGNDEAEFIIVDNNSNDRTKDVIEEARSKNHRLRYVLEPKQGVCAARNRGMAEAKGDILAFTDDDVVVDKNWLNNIRKGYEQYDPDCLFGKIFPDWQGQPVPRWLAENKKCWANLAMLDWGEQVLDVTNEHMHFFGANVSMKRDFYTQGFRFNENLGPVGVNLMRGDDTDLFYKLWEAKRKMVYDPSMIVWHKVEKKRMTKKYFREWNYCYGISEAKMEREKNFVCYFKVPRWRIRALLELPMRWLGYTCTFQSEKAVNAEFRFFYTLGYVSQCLQSRK